MRFGAAVGLLMWGALGASAQTCSGIQLLPPAVLPSATVNVPYTTSLSGSTMGGTPPYSYSAAGLPPGLGMDSTGLITGTPTTATTGYFTGSVTVTDHCSPPQNATGLLFYIQIFAQPLTITTAVLPHGVLGSSYSQPIPVSGGSPPYSFSLFRSSLTGTGLTLDPSTGIVSGSPAAPGPISFRVEVTDQAGSQAFQSLTLPVDSNISVSVPGAVEVPVQGAVSVNLSASGGVAPYTWSPVGQLPPGLTFTPGGLLGGATSQAGNLLIPVQVTDAQGFSAPATVRVNSFGLTNPATLPAGTTVAPYFAVFFAAGGTAPYNFSGTGLPAGLIINRFGNLSGAVAQPGVYPFSVQVQDGTGLAVSANYSLTISIPPPLSMTAPSLPNGTVQVPYSGTVSGSASGGNPPYQWSIRNGSLPPGIALSPTGILSGTPTLPGTFTFALQAIDGSGASGAVGATIQISAAALSITTQSPLTSGIMNVDYPSQVLTAAGGFPPYTFSLTGGAFPAGITLNMGLISGKPTELGADNGNFSPTITVQDSAGTQATSTLALHIRPPATDIVLATQALSFSLARGASSLPASQNVTIASSDVNQVLNYSVQVTAQADWMTVSSGTTTPGALVVNLTSQALALAGTPGSRTASITLTCTTTNSCPTATGQIVTVTLVVNDTPPVLSSATELLSFSATSLAAGPSTQPVTLQNTGGGVLTFTSIACGAPWCSLGNAPGSLAGGSSASVAVTADPTGLPAGYYRTTVDVVSSGGPVSIPVTLLVAQSAQILLAPSGAQLRMHVGGTPGNANGSFLVNLSGNATLNWTASVNSGSSWLILNTPSGVASSSAPGTVSYSIDPSAVALLPAQPQYGIIQVNVPGAIDSTQYFELVLNISPDSVPLTPDPSPAGLVFLTEPGAPPPPQTVLVRVAGAAQNPGFQTSFQAAAATSDGATWLSVSSSTGSTSASQPAKVEVTVDPSNLAPGIYHGGVSFSFTSAAAPTVNVTLIVENPLPGPDSQLLQRTALPKTTGPRCTPKNLAPTQTGLVNNFSTPASWPTPLAVLLLDDCGNTISGGQIVATFSNGDPPLALSPVNNTAGMYSGTWTPRSTGPQVSINALANASGFSAAHLQITGQVVPNSAPVLTPHGTLHVFNPQVGAPLAPGTIVQIYGSGLAPTGTVANTIPLPKAMTGTSLIIGGITAPLYYVGPGQINAQIPFELDPNGQYQVIVNANGSFTAPITIQLAPVTPGLAAYTDGGLIAQHAADGSLINDASPAQPGEYVVAYMAGLGDTTVPVATGAGSPPSPSLAWAGVLPTLTLNGASVPVLFAGMTPGLVGLYQLNFQIPADQPNGTVKLVVTQSGFASNSTTLPVHQ
jgi:uncharacterized protein (TIGR03437 family)